MRPDTPEESLRKILEMFVQDPPSSRYQCGYMSALLTVWDEVLELSILDPDYLRAMRVFVDANSVYR